MQTKIIIWIFLIFKENIQLWFNNLVYNYLLLFIIFMYSLFRSNLMFFVDNPNSIRNSYNSIKIYVRVVYLLLTVFFLIFWIKSLFSIFIIILIEIVFVVEYSQRLKYIKSKRFSENFQIFLLIVWWDQKFRIVISNSYTTSYF